MYLERHIFCGAEQHHPQHTPLRFFFLLAFIYWVQNSLKLLQHLHSSYARAIALRSTFGFASVCVSCRYAHRGSTFCWTTFIALALLVFRCLIVSRGHQKQPSAVFWCPLVIVSLRWNYNIGYRNFTCHKRVVNR